MRELQFTEKEAGKSLFKVVKMLLPHFLNRDVFRLIRSKKIIVNNKKCSHDYVLQSGDTVQLYIAETHFQKKEAKRFRKFNTISKEIIICYEDSQCVIVNKPSGLLVHAADRDYSDSLLERVKALLYSRNEYDLGALFHPAACNRLDRNTSGLVVFAKTQEALSRLTEGFRKRATEKWYLAVVTGTITRSFLVHSEMHQTGEGVMRVTSLSTDYTIPDKKKFIENNSERAVMTVTPLYSTTSKNMEVTLVKVHLWTGKRHQIRVQLAKTGHPLIGDNKYGGKNSREILKLSGLHGYLLHAFRLKLEGIPIIEADLPLYFIRFLTDNGWSSVKVGRL